MRGNGQWPVDCSTWNNFIQIICLVLVYMQERAELLKSPVMRLHLTIRDVSRDLLHHELLLMQDMLCASHALVSQTVHFHRSALPLLIAIISTTDVV
jgi:hypothetical protein